MLHRRSATKNSNGSSRSIGDDREEAMIYAEAKKRIDWTKEEEDLLREHLRNGGGFSWESMRKLAKTLGRTVIAVRGRLTKIRKEEKEKR